MDRPIIENKYLRDRNMIKEMYLYWFLKHPVFIFFYAYTICYLIYSSLCIMGGYTDSSFIFVSFLMLLCALLIPISIMRSVRLTHKRDMEMSDGRPIDVTVRVWEDKITVESQGSVQQILYTSIKNAYGTKSYFMLSTKAKRVVAFKKGCYLIGGEKELREFLKTKSIRVKR